MTYKIFASKEEAMAYSKAEAVRRGCRGDVTMYWWSWIVHEDGRAALVADDVATHDEDGNVVVPEGWVDALSEDWTPETDMT